MATAPDAGTANKAVHFDTQQTTVLRVFYTRPDGKCQVRMDSAAWRAQSLLAEHPALLRKQPMSPLMSWGISGMAVQGWELHVWGSAALHPTSWEAPLAATGCGKRSRLPVAFLFAVLLAPMWLQAAPSGKGTSAVKQLHQRALHNSIVCDIVHYHLQRCRQTSRGCFWDVEVVATSSQELGLIVHSGDSKSAGGDVVSIDTLQTKQLWLVDGYKQPFFAEDDAVAVQAGSLSTCSAHWCATAS